MFICLKIERLDHHLHLYKSLVESEVVSLSTWRTDTLQKRLNIHSLLATCGFIAYNVLKLALFDDSLVGE
jgi:hypothetical protein